MVIECQDSVLCSLRCEFGFAFGDFVSDVGFSGSVLTTQHSQGILLSEAAALQEQSHLEC